MREHSNNPTENKLGPGINPDDVRNAVQRSGYPLQTLIAEALRSEFTVQQEWSYLDRDSQEVRNIDILASKPLWDPSAEQPRIRPHVNLIIECKQSNLPHIFFLSSDKPWLPNFPMLAGLHDNENIVITTDDDPSTWHETITNALGVEAHRFAREESEICMSFSKCVRKGSELELSGSEAFNAIVLPLLKAMQHFQIAEAPPRTAVYFDCHIVIGLGVLDSPMVGVRVSEDSQELTMLPWVRVIRHQTDSPSYRGPHNKLWALDIVHKGFVKTYLDNHLLPFAKEFARLSTKHQEILATGEAFAKGMGKNPFKDIEGRLERKGLPEKVARSRAMLQGISRSIFKKRPQDHQ